MSVKNRLRSFLNMEGLKITTAAQKSGIPYRSMQNYLSGEREPGVEALVAMNTRLGISLDWLLTGEGHMRRHTPESELVAESPREGAVLSLLRQLPDADQQEIELAAQTKKRLLDAERRLEQMTKDLAASHAAKCSH